MLTDRSVFQVVGDVPHDYESLRKAEALKPDVILLDTGLPGPSGIEVARRVLQSCPDSKILLLCESADVVVIQKAISLGARGCVEKKRLGVELLTALQAVGYGRQYFGSAFTGIKVSPLHLRSVAHLSPLKNGHPTTSAAKHLNPRHEVEFYSDDLTLLEGVITYLAESLKAGNRTVVIATEAHRQVINHRLWAQALDWPVVTEEGLYISLDAANVLSEIMGDSGPNRNRLLSFFEPLFHPRQMVDRGKERRLVAFGGMVGLLCAQGRPEAALQLEKLWNEESRAHDCYLRCAYPVTCQIEEKLYAQICQEHETVRSPLP
jgi:DNA-binding NarL/FixJ family response regulator